MNWHVSGAIGGPAVPIEGASLTQGLGFPLRQVGEAAVNVASYAVGGAGDALADLNAHDFTGQTGTTYLYIGKASVVTFVHNSVAYMWTGPTDVNIGLGGNYTAISGDLTPTGTADHDQLSRRLDPDQHSMGAITGLVDSQAAQDQALQDHKDAPDPHTQYVLNTEGLATWVLALYGGIVSAAVSAIGTLDGGWHTVESFTDPSLSNPLHVTQDVPNNGLRMDGQAILLSNIFVSLSFTEENAGREIFMRVANTTKGTFSAALRFPVGRNQSGVICAVGGHLTPVGSAEGGDLFQIQIGGGDTFNSVSIESAEFSLSGAGIAQGVVI